jgi:RHS repeat-associated protein
MPTKYTYTGQYSNVSDFGLTFYNARWLRSVPETQWRGYDPSLGRFAQADTIVPGGVQGYDRYAYGLNNPSRFVDPSGHEPVPWGQIIVFLISHVIRSGGLTTTDWEDAANTYLPAQNDGSNLAVSATVISPPGAGVVEANYVTTSNGDFQMYITSGAGAGASIPTGVGASVGYSQGAMNGIVDADEFEGGALQLAGGVTLPVVYAGVTADKWWSVQDGVVGEITGYDINGGIGTPGFSGSLTAQNAVKGGDVLKNVLTTLGLEDTEAGIAYQDYVNSVTSFKMRGVGLFACRLAQQCGRWSIAE